jgi:hypothetical protein
MDGVHTRILSVPVFIVKTTPSLCSLMDTTGLSGAHCPGARAEKMMSAAPSAPAYRGNPCGLMAITGAR